jgi:hypothetical protein
MTATASPRSAATWAAVDALSDAEIAAAVRADPDAVPLNFDWSKAVLVLPPRKKARSGSTRMCSSVVAPATGGA